MKLTELEPYSLKIINQEVYHQVNNFCDIDGIRFLCPKCFIDNKGPVCTHGILCWKPSVPQTVPPIPGR